MRSHSMAASAGPTEAGSVRNTVGLFGSLALAALLLVAILGVPAAHAANSFVPSGEITAGELTSLARIAVDEDTGNVLVVDSGKNRVDVFDSSGPGAGLLTTFGEGDLSGPYGIAIDQSNGDVYVTDPGDEQILRYSTDGAPTPTYTLDAGYTGPAAGTGSGEVGSFTSAIAVDPINGDLLVADRGNDRVSRFSSAGAFVSSFNGADSPDGAFTHLEDVVLSPGGKIFVTDGEAAAGAPSRVLRFSNAGVYEATLRDPAATGDAYLAYDAKHTELIVGDARECFFCPVSMHVLDPASGATLFDVSVPSEQITGLASDPGSGRLYAASQRGEFFAEPKVAVFASQMQPELVLDAPSPGTPFSVHLSGTVNPGGVATDYHFEVSKDGGASWQESPVSSAGEGTSPVAVEADLEVEPNTDYIAKLVATNTQGAQVATATQPFTTAVSVPGTKTLPASDLEETSAVINGSINPYGLQTTFYFEYGPTTAYGTKIPAEVEAPAGFGRVPKTFSRKLSGLTPGATYHYRLVSTSSAGTAESGDQSFTTLASGSVPVRAYEQVTPVDKEGATVIPNLSFLVAPDGHGFSYTTKGTSQNAPLEPRSLIVREADDWSRPIPTDLPTDQGFRAFFETTTQAVSDDFTKTFSVTNRALTPGAVQGGANLYIVDVASRSLRLIGSNPSPQAFQNFTGGQQIGKYLAGAPDFSWILFTSPDPLKPGAPEDAMYRWSEEDGLEIVSVLADGEPSKAAARVYQPASADGTKIYYTALGGSEEGVFLREPGEPPVAIAVRPHMDPSPSTLLPPALLGTNKDGRYAFIGSFEALTADALPPFGAGLYRYDRVEDKIEYLGVQVKVEISGINQMDRGSFGIGDDGNTIYFSSVDEEGEHLLSVWHEGAFANIGQAPSRLGLRISSDGRYLVFYEDGSLFRYDADPGTSTCVSCTQDGTPVPFDDWLLRDVDDQGTVYFDSPAPLVSSDANGAIDVYAFGDGQYTLISPGNAPVDSLFAAISENGKDVFFTTTQKLVRRDNDQSLDVYDARVNGGFPAQNQTPGPDCRTDCGALPPTPPQGVGGSETLQGFGNAKAHAKKIKCGKGKRKQMVKGKSKCVKKKSKKHKASTKKRGSSR